MAVHLLGDGPGLLQAGGRGNRLRVRSRKRPRVGPSVAATPRTRASDRRSRRRDATSKGASGRGLDAAAAATPIVRGRGPTTQVARTSTLEDADYMTASAPFLESMKTAYESADPENPGVQPRPGFGGVQCVRRADLPLMNRGDAATWIFRGHESRRRRGRDVCIPWT